MASKLIKLKDGTLIEIEVDQQKAQPISNRAAKPVEAAIDGIQDTILKACKPVTAVWKELNKDLLIDQAEVELGLGFRRLWASRGNWISYPSAETGTA